MDEELRDRERCSNKHSTTLQNKLQMSGQDLEEKEERIVSREQMQDVLKKDLADIDQRIAEIVAEREKVGSSHVPPRTVAMIPVTILSGLGTIQTSRRYI